MPAPPRPKRRDFHALAAKQRHAGPLKHRFAPRGGARNTRRDLLDAWEEEVEPESAGDEPGSERLASLPADEAAVVSGRQRRPCGDVLPEAVESGEEDTRSRLGDLAGDQVQEPLGLHLVDEEQ